ncbi:MAG: hypothetical protein IKL99_02315, partial [Oscillospiraceae bacterium]|nr:hypothetical protein [Oscillospiraceae bacterium]
MPKFRPCSSLSLSQRTSSAQKFLLIIDGATDAAANILYISPSFGKSFRQYLWCKKAAARATFRKKGIASRRLFSRNTSSKSHGRRQPCRGFSSRLASKTSLFEVLCSFAPEIFSHAAALRAQEYFVSFKA